MFQPRSRICAGRDLKLCYMAPDDKLPCNVVPNRWEYRMKILGHAIAIVGLVSGIAIPAFAASHSMNATMMTCADFTAMDSAMQVKAMEVMAMASEGMTSDQMSSEDTVASDATASNDTTSDAMASDDLATNTMVATARTCAANPDMMAMDAMMTNKG